VTDNLHAFLGGAPGKQPARRRRYDRLPFDPSAVPRRSRALALAAVQIIRCFLFNATVAMGEVLCKRLVDVVLLRIRTILLLMRIGSGKAGRSSYKCLIEPVATDKLSAATAWFSPRCSRVA
jgi:hypothetical protein